MDIWLLIFAIISIIISIAVVVLVLIRNGPQGQTGNDGPIGQMGPTGQQGTGGPRGQTGVTGYDGTIPGDRGPTGQMGIAGNGGGTTGITGQPGATGQTGQQGNMGPTITNPGALGIYYITTSGEGSKSTIGSSFTTPLYNAYYFCPHQGGTINIEYNALYEPPIGSTFVLNMYSNYAGAYYDATKLYSTSANNGSTKYNVFLSRSETQKPGTNINNGQPQPLNGWGIFAFNCYTFTYIGDFINKNGNVTPHTFAVSITSMPTNGGNGSTGKQTDCPS